MIPVHLDLANNWTKKSKIKCFLPDFHSNRSIGELSAGLIFYHFFYFTGWSNQEPQNSSVSVSPLLTLSKWTVENTIKRRKIGLVVEFWGSCLDQPLTEMDSPTIASPFHGNGKKNSWQCTECTTVWGKFWSCRISETSSSRCAMKCSKFETSAIPIGLLQNQAHNKRWTRTLNSTSHRTLQSYPGNS